MDTNPAINVVVFEFVLQGQSGRAMGQAPTQAADCIRQVWQTIQQQHPQLTALDVKAIYSEWEPAPEDVAFVDTYFSPDLEFTYSFERPAEEEWEAAFAKVAQLMKDLLLKEATKQTSEAKLLPILRNDDSFAEMVMSIPLCDQLGLFLANVTFKADGGLGLSYVLSKESPPSPAALWDQAFTHLAYTLSATARQYKGETFLLVQREGGLAASAIGLPNFGRQAANWVRCPKIVIGIPNPNYLYVCAANSKAVAVIRELTLASDYMGAIALTPQVILMEGAKIIPQYRRS